MLCEKERNVTKDDNNGNVFIIKYGQCQGEQLL